jgi:CRP-like cAMP-binding protein
MPPPLIDYLKNVPMFRGLPDMTLHQLTQGAQLHNLLKGEVLLSEGNPSHSLFIIHKGWVKVFRAGPGGAELVLNQIGPGQVIGEAAMVDRAPRSASVVALSPVQAIELKYEIFLITLEQNPRFMMAFIGDMFERLRFANLYLQQTIEWCQKIAEGNYEAVESQIQTTRATIVDLNQSGEARVGAYLSSIFSMVKEVKEREAQLKEQISMIPTIEIDQSKREQDVRKLAKRSFFMRVQNTAEEMRERRKRRTAGEEEP